MKRDKNLYFIIISCVAIIGIGFACYFAFAIYIFGNNEYKNEFVELANFGTFNSYFISVCNLILLGFISYITYRSANNYNRQQVTPLLEFRVTTSRIKDNADSWFLFSCTDAAARSISIRFFNDNKRSKWIACYSVGGNAEIELPWLKYASRIEVLYSDVFGENFFKLTYENLIGSTEKLNKAEFNEILLSERVNHADLLLQHIGYVEQMQRPHVNTFLGYYDYVKAF